MTKADKVFEEVMENYGFEGHIDGSDITQVMSYHDCLENQRVYDEVVGMLIHRGWNIYRVSGYASFILPEDINADYCIPS